MYSLVSASVLGFDLARAPGGARVARVLRTALALRPGDLPALAAVAGRGDGTDRGLARALALASGGGGGRAREALPAVVRALDDEGRRTAALDRLRRAGLGDLEALVSLLRSDVLGWAESVGAGSGVPVDVVVDVVVDAVVAEWSAGLVDEEVTAALRAPWHRALPALPAPDSVVGPCRERVEALLDRAARLTPAELDRLEVAGEAGRRAPSVDGALPWAAAMHSATWAVHLAGRVVPAAVAQLRLVEAVHGRVPADALAAGCWSTLSGAVQAEVVADLLDEETAAALAGGTLLALGLPG